MHPENKKKLLENQEKTKEIFETFRDITCLIETDITLKIKTEENSGETTLKAFTPDCRRILTHEQKQEKNQFLQKVSKNLQHLIPVNYKIHPKDISHSTTELSFSEIEKSYYFTQETGTITAHRKIFLKKKFG